jgi:hypothetical protein
MKYLNQPGPMAPTLNVRIKVQKENNPVCAVINNIHAPTYKLANDLTQIKMKNDHKLITMDIKDLYINILIKDILFITKDRLGFSNTEIYIKKQSIILLREILNQNYLTSNITNHIKA